MATFRIHENVSILRLSLVTRHRFSSGVKPQLVYVSGHVCCSALAANLNNAFASFFKMKRNSVDGR